MRDRWYCLRDSLTLLDMNGRDVQEMLKSHWPIIATVATGLIAWGTLNADMSNTKADVTVLKQELAKTKADAQADHDAIVRMDERTKTMADDMKDVKAALKELAKK